MKIVTALTVAALSLGTTGPDGVPAQDEVIQEDTLALERERYQRITVPVSVQGEGPFRFLVDTGAEATVVSREIASSLALPSAGRALVIGMASEEEAELVDIDYLVMGSMDFCCLTSPVLSRSKIGADGILGLDSLQYSRVLIDFEDGRLTVQDARENLGQRGFEIVIRAKERLGQLIITRAKVDGVRTDIIIDTGSQISIGNTALRRKLRARHEGPVEWEDVHGNSQSGNITLAGEIDLDGVGLRNIPIAIADAPPFRHLGLHEKPAMILGMQHLRLFRRVAIDFRTQRILFDLPSSAIPVDNIFQRFNATRIGGG